MMGVASRSVPFDKLRVTATNQEILANKPRLLAVTLSLSKGH